MRIALLLGLALASSAAAAQDGDWHRTYVSWGQAPGESSSLTQAGDKAKASLAQLRAECEATPNGRLSYSLRDGLCTKQTEPLLCPAGCFDCSVTGAVACTHDKGVALKAGDAVVTTLDTELLSGNTIVGRLERGTALKVARLNGDYAALTTPTGAAVNGWARLVHLTPAQPQ